MTKYRDDEIRGRSTTEASVLSILSDNEIEKVEQILKVLEGSSIYSTDLILESVGLKARLSALVVADIKSCTLKTK